MSWTLAGGGLRVDLPDGWEGQILPAERGPQDGDGLGPGPVMLHAGNFPLPPARGDYGSGAVERMGSGHALICVLEHGPDELESPVFAAVGPPRVTAAMFSPSQMQRTIAGMAGAQRFFQQSGRTFCLYAVIGSSRARGQLATAIDAVVSTLEIDAR